MTALWVWGLLAARASRSHASEDITAVVEEKVMILRHSLEVARSTLAQLAYRAALRELLKCGAMTSFAAALVV